MIDLSRYVGRKQIECDAHTHLFDGKDSCPELILPESKLTVAFADIRFSDQGSYTKGKTSKAYDKFISDEYPKISDKVILLATAPSSDEAIEIFEKHKDVIKGFGEFKCYGYYTVDRPNGEKEKIKLPYGDLEWVELVLEYDSEKRMPVYIHYSIFDDDRVKALTGILERYPDIPIVLCHCGMGESRDHISTIDELSGLMFAHGNLWTDISFSALPFFAASKNAMSKLPKERVLIGSDLNPVLKEFPEKRFNEIIRSTKTNMEIVNGYGVDFYGNLKRLFGIQG